VFGPFYLSPDKFELIFEPALAMESIPEDGLTHENLMCRLRVDPPKVHSPLGNKGKTTTLNSFNAIDGPLLLVP
jgi:hypothetical protein